LPDVGLIQEGKIRFERLFVNIVVVVVVVVVVIVVVVDGEVVEGHHDENVDHDEDKSELQTGACDDLGVDLRHPPLQ